MTVYGLVLSSGWPPFPWPPFPLIRPWPLGHGASDAPLPPLALPVELLGHGAPDLGALHVGYVARASQVKPVGLVQLRQLFVWEVVRVGVVRQSVIWGPLSPGGEINNESRRI